MLTKVYTHKTSGHSEHKNLRIFFCIQHLPKTFILPTWHFPVNLAQKKKDLPQLHMCIFVMYTCMQKPKEVMRAKGGYPLQLELPAVVSHLILVIGTELKSSARVICVFEQ